MQIFPEPEPAIGEPGHGYPMPWAVQTWVPGTDATIRDPGQSNGFAADMAQLILALRASDVGGRSFGGTGRGGQLPDHDPWMSTCCARSEGLLDVAALRKVWAGLLELPDVDADVMTVRTSLGGGEWRGRSCRRWESRGITRRLIRS